MTITSVTDNKQWMSNSSGLPS